MKLVVVMIMCVVYGLCHYFVLYKSLKSMGSASIVAEFGPVLFVFIDFFHIC